MSNAEEKFTVNKSKGKTLPLLCAVCKNPTKHRVVVSLEKDGSEVDKSEGWSIEWADSYQVAQCQGCESVVFRHVHWFSEDTDEEGNPYATENLYPKRSSTSITAKAFSNVSANLRRIYRELVDCFNNDSPILCAAGLRALVEGICAQQGVSDGPVEIALKAGGSKIVRKTNLEGRIAGLQEKGFLTQSGAQTLHEHRYLGNSAVHELARPSEAELRLAIEIVEHTLEQLYELPEKAEELKHAMLRRKK
jgi:hypothetical protein